MSSVVIGMKTAKTVFTPENCRLLSIIQLQKPCSVSELSDFSGRAQPNVSRALSILVEAGVVRMVGARPKRPELVANSIEVDLNELA